MCVSFYTSRVVLQALGVQDYGIYNVVGGISSALTFFSIAFSTSTQRFLNYELGNGNIKRLHQIFGLNLMAFTVLAIAVFVFGAIFGHWFIVNRLVIPPDRVGDALIVFYSVLFCLSTLFVFSVYESALIARENMKLYAWLGIIDAVLKLVIAFAVMIMPHKLIWYGILLALAQLLSKLVLVIYCRKQYSECRAHFYWNKDMFKEVFSFSTWNVYIGGTWMLNEQGLNVLLNLFFGPVINAAYGFATQLSYTVLNFSTKFFVAFRPQIIMSYASGDHKYVKDLMFASSRYIYYLMWIFALPIMLRAPYILNLWLDNVPDYTASFTTWMLLLLAVASLNTPINTVAMATGRLKRTALYANNIYVLAFPMIWLGLKLGMAAYLSFAILIVMRLLCVVVTLVNIRRDIVIPVKEYLKQVLWPIFYISVISAVLGFGVDYIIPQNFIGLLAVCALCVVISATLVITMGLSQQERGALKGKVVSMVARVKK
jgi:O-antigen/teichoic acid export membrane protein